VTLTFKNDLDIVKDQLV